MAFAFDVVLGDLLGFRCLHRNHNALYAIHSRARHVDHIFVKSDFCLIEFQELIERCLHFFLGLPFGAECGLLGHGFFQYKS
jgi:hypothetical protein